MLKRLFKLIWIALTGFMLLSAALASRILLYSQTVTAGHYDCAIVLGAGVTDEKPSPVFQSRIDHAVTLFQTGIVSHVIFTGGRGEGDKLAESEAGRDSAIQQGIPPGVLFTEIISKTTQQNLQEAKKVMSQQSLKTAVLVSDPLHLYRASIIAKDTDIDSISSATPTTRYTTWKSQMPFLLREVYFTLHFMLFKQ